MRRHLMELIPIILEHPLYLLGSDISKTLHGSSPLYRRNLETRDFGSI